MQYYNIVYILLAILLCLSSLQIIKKYINKKYLYILLTSYILIIILAYKKIIEVINNIFNFEYTPVKMYIIVLIITNIIALITVNKKQKLEKLIINSILFITIIILLIINILIFLSVKLNIINIDIKLMIYPINISIIIFIGYIISNLTIYLYNNVKSK